MPVSKAVTQCFSTVEPVRILGTVKLSSVRLQPLYLQLNGLLLSRLNCVEHALFNHPVGVNHSRQIVLLFMMFRVGKSSLSASEFIQLTEAV
jgi:hypothetical protein